MGRPCLAFTSPSCALRLRAEGRPDEERSAAQNAVNPKFVPRQHLLQYAVEGAEAGDSTEIEALMKARVPGGEREGREDEEAERRSPSHLPSSLPSVPRCSEGPTMSSPRPIPSTARCRRQRWLTDQGYACCLALLRREAASRW